VISVSRVDGGRGRRGGPSVSERSPAKVRTYVKPQSAARAIAAPLPTTNQDKGPSYPLGPATFRLTLARSPQPVDPVRGAPQADQAEHVDGRLLGTVAQLQLEPAFRVRDCPAHAYMPPQHALYGSDGVLVWLASPPGTVLSGYCRPMLVALPRRRGCGERSRTPVLLGG
jgi:hypothetical protein